MNENFENDYQIRFEEFLFRRNSGEKSKTKYMCVPKLAFWQNFGINSSIILKPEHFCEQRTWYFM